MVYYLYAGEIQEIELFEEHTIALFREDEVDKFGFIDLWISLSAGILCKYDKLTEYDQTG